MPLWKRGERRGEQQTPPSIPISSSPKMVPSHLPISCYPSPHPSRPFLDHLPISKNILPFSLQSPHHFLSPLPSSSLLFNYAHTPTHLPISPIPPYTTFTPSPYLPAHLPISKLTIPLTYLPISPSAPKPPFSNHLSTCLSPHLTPLSSCWPQEEIKRYQTRRLGNPG